MLAPTHPPSPEPPSRSGIAPDTRRLVLQALVLLLVLSAATIAVTWPLAANLTTQLPLIHYVSFTDSLVAGWLLAWESHALVSAPWAIAEANIFHPTPHALFYGPTGLGALPLFAPVFWASGNATLALNVTFLGGVALTAWAMAVVVLRWTGSFGAALVSGWVLLMSRWLVRGMVATAPFAAALMYFPFILYVAARATGWQVLWLVPLVALQCSVDVAYVAPAVLIPLGLIAAWRLLRRSTRADGLRLTLAIALSVLALSPLLAGYAAVRRANPALQSQTVWITNRLLLDVWEYVFAGPAEVPRFLLRVLAVAALLLVLRRVREGARDDTARLWTHGLLWTIVGFLLSIPVAWLVNGVPMTTPMGWLEQVFPAVAVLRTRDRLGVAALMGLALLAGAAVAEIERWLMRVRERGADDSALAQAVPWMARLGITALIVALYLSSPHASVKDGQWLVPMRLWEAPRWSPEAVAVLRAGRGPVLELPVPTVKPNPSSHARSMFRSTDHFRPLVNGHHSYYPKEHPARMELAARIPDPAALAALRRETGLTLIAIHLPSLMPAARNRWLRLAAAPPPGLRVAFQSQDELLLRVSDAPATPWR